jgi:hypothetical protein
MVQNFSNFMDGLPSLPVFLLIVFAVTPVLAVAHELGHGLIAIARLPGRATLRIGREPPLTTFSIGRLDFRLHPFVRPWRFDALCTYDAWQTRTDAILISLGGPVASLLVGLAALRASRWFPLSRVRTVLAVAAFCALGSFVLCMIPMTLTAEKGGPAMRTDGKLILSALTGRRPSGRRV